jgi:hypothetical protein
LFGEKRGYEACEGEVVLQRAEVAGNVSMVSCKEGSFSVEMENKKMEKTRRKSMDVMAKVYHW